MGVWTKACDSCLMPCTSNQQVAVEESKPLSVRDRVDSDEFLVERAKQGDSLAFGELVQCHRRACMKRAYMILHDRNRVVENQCLMRIRDDRNVPFLYLDEPTESNVRLEMVSQSPDPEGQLGSTEVGGLLRREINRMSPLLRNAMLLRDVNQLPISGVAGKLGLSVPATKSRLRRARLEMQARISPHCGREGVGTLTHGQVQSGGIYARQLA